MINSIVYYFLKSETGGRIKLYEPRGSYDLLLQYLISCLTVNNNPYHY